MNKKLSIPQLIVGVLIIAAVLGILGWRTFLSPESPNIPTPPAPKETADMAAMRKPYTLRNFKGNPTP